jgi:hypothetical protein
MRCYTVCTSMFEEGIEPDQLGDRTGIIFTKRDTNVILPLENKWAEELIRLAKAEAALAGKEPEKYKLRRFSHADTDDEGRLIPKPTTEASAQAMVLVRCVPEFEGDTRHAITAATWDEHWNEHREAVVRTYRPLAQAVGVQILMDQHPGGMLLVLDRGSSFRVEVAGRDRKVRHNIFTFRDWRYPRLERVVPPMRDRKVA